MKLPVLAVHQEKSTFYVGAIAASDLSLRSEIAQRREGSNEGYQRVLSPGRVKAVSRYIQNGGSIPGSVILAVNHGSVNAAGNRLELADRPDASWVIDGQHRLAGAIDAYENHSVSITLPIAAYLDISLEEQIALFITINREAKNVPSSLYLDLLGQLPRTKNDKEQLEERITDIARTLNGEEASPFFQRIIFTRNARNGEISATNFARVLRPVLNPQGGVLSTYTLFEQGRVIDNYYRSLQSQFPDNFIGDSTIFFKTVGFGGVWRVFPYVFGLALRTKGAASVAAFNAIFSEVRGFDFDGWRQLGSGSKAEIQAGDDLLAVLRQAHEGDNKTVASGLILD